MILPLRVLGRASVKRICSGLAKLPISCATHLRSSSPSSSWSQSPFFRVTKQATAWPVISCGLPTTAASATAGWRTSADLDFHGAEAVAADVHDVVDAAEDPEVAVFVAARGVAGEVDAWDALPILLLVALGIAPEGARHARPGPADDEEAFAIGSTGLPCRSTTSAMTPGIGSVPDPASAEPRRAWARS